MGVALAQGFPIGPVNLAGQDVRGGSMGVIGGNEGGRDSAPRLHCTAVVAQDVVCLGIEGTLIGTPLAQHRRRHQRHLALRGQSSLRLGRLIHQHQAGQMADNAVRGGELGRRILRQVRDG